MFNRALLRLLDGHRIIYIHRNRDDKYFAGQWAAFASKTSIRMSRERNRRNSELRDRSFHVTINCYHPWVSPYCFSGIEILTHNNVSTTRL